ncbi:hypothetical protein KR093_010943 [Drosophila rubida]|uniref:DUF4802 domain-containing protein n=1 Tax=Drosophila rubida TaxID=30044 RepID=A0AAD4K322_9MUSC|nr:hypothetical protein KR093_010943 [Drosophila rubida]
MDDMVYQCSNQNSIYVLNAGYNPSYGDFGAHAMHTQMTATGREMNGSRTTRTRNSIGASCSSAACSLQHKFKSFGTAAASNGNSSAMPSTAATATATATAIATTAATMATTIIAATATSTAAEAAATPTPAAAAAAATATTIATSYVNPVATSMSTAMCSPATAALQKLFNCSVGGGGGGGNNVCQNVSHRNHQQQPPSQQQQQQQQQQSNHSSNNNNCPVGSHNNSCLSATTSSHRSICDPHEGPAGAGAGALPLLGSTVAANKKKCTNVKSTLIAKKTKFLKFLEEEKWRSSNNVAQLTADDAEACGAPLALLPSSNEAEPYTASTTSSAMAATSSLAAHSGIKHNNNNNNSGSSSNSREAAGAEQQQNKLNNWSMHNDSNNKLTNYQQLELNKQTAKSSYELYQEAADILGLSCSLCDNCRCLDCQSGYFDCADDDDESYSEQSLMDEYDEYDYHGYGYEQQSPLLTTAHHAGPNQPAMTQPDQHQLQQQQQQQQLQAPDLNLCYAVDCQQNCIRSDDGHRKEGTFQTDSEHEHENETEADAETEPNTATKSEHRLAIDFDLINATSSQVLQNCATFNDLSLLDAERRVEPFT